MFKNEEKLHINTGPYFSGTYLEFTAVTANTSCKEYNYAEIPILNMEAVCSPEKL
jgi:hypothetical protein